MSNEPKHITDEVKVNWLVTNELEPCPPLPDCGVDFCDSDLISLKRLWVCEANYMAGPLKWVPANDYVHNPQHAVLLLPLIGWWQNISRMPDEWVSVEYLADGSDLFSGGKMEFGGAAPDFPSALCMAFLKSRGIGLPVVGGETMRKGLLNSGLFGASGLALSAASVPPPKPKLNRYTCNTCLQSIITIDRDKGMTPYLMACRATPDCQGQMQSAFYLHVVGEPTFEWRKPAPEEYKRMSAGMKDHIDSGGLDIYPIEKE